MKNALPLVLLVLVMVCWAANFHITKIALRFYSPVAVAVWRFFFGIVGLFGIIYYRFGTKLFRFKFSQKEWWYIFLTSFFGIFLTIYFFNQGLKTTSAINGSLIIATSPAITAIFTFLFERKKIGPFQWFAIGVSFFGVALILVKGDLSKLAHLEFEVGDLYILMMAIVFCFSQIIVGKYLAHLDATLLTTYSTLIALVLFGVFAAPDLISTSLPNDLSFWGSVIFMGFLGTSFAYVAFYYCVVRAGATTSTLYMNLIPFFTVILAFPFGERLFPVQLVGGIIIIAGLLLFTYAKRRRSHSGKKALCK